MADQLSYKTLRTENSAEFIINKSRFIGYGCPCQTEEEALAFLARIRQKHKDATHNCYAYIIGLNSGIMRYSDDGEPGGTAGMPIIEVMKARGVVNCAVVVTRYFGGILLGAGGLVRAYAQGSKTALDAAGVHPNIKFTTKDDDALITMVEHGLGMSIVPELLLAGGAGRLAALELEPPSSRIIGLAVRGGQSIGPATARFVEHVRRWVAVRYGEMLPETRP